MNKVIPLSDLDLNCKATINNISCEEHINRRFLDLGIIPNTPIVPIFKSISGDPTAYEVRNILLAIRCQDAKNIFVNIN